MTASFAEIRRTVPSVHVFKPAVRNRKTSDGYALSDLDGGVTVLVPNNIDEGYEDRRYSEGYTEGDGSRETPYTYKSAAPVSPHYVIIDLWFGFRELTKQTDTEGVFIEVNGWLLEVGPEGVTASDGHFTKLS